VSVDRIPRKSQLPRGQPSGHQGSRKIHAAIYACKMYIQRGRDPINKLVVGSVVLFDSRNQTVAEVKDNRVVGRNAGSYGKFDDSIGAVIVSKLIESGARNEKVKAVGYVFGMGCRIKSQIDETHRTMWEGNYLETAFWFASSEDIPLQGEDGPLPGRRRMVRRARNEIRLAELRSLGLGSLHRPMSGSNRRLQEKEISNGSSAFQSCGGGNCSGRVSRLCNCWLVQLTLRLLTGF